MITTKDTNKDTNACVVDVESQFMCHSPSTIPVPMNGSHRYEYIRSSIVVLCCLLFLSYLSVHQAQAASNITSDGTMGTTVNQTGNVLNITDGTRPGGGQNLFHSFGQFIVDTGDIANFTNNSGLSTSNILSRVTGGTRSDIFGTIQTTGFPDANLFLINPAGIVFGSGASLNVEGSFHASTADYILMSDGGRFGADTTNPANTNLTIANPTSFGFLNSSVTPIELLNGASLNVSEDQSLSLVGGNIMLDGATIAAPGGRINLASVASAGEVMSFETSGVDVNGITMFGNINLNSSTVNADGDGGGNIFVRGGQFIMESGSMIRSETNGTTNGGIIRFEVDTFSLSNGSISGDTNFSPGFVRGDGGDIRFVNTRKLTVNNGDITTNSNLGGDAGDIYFDNVGEIKLNNGNITATTNQGGQGGNISFNAVDRLSLTNDSDISVSSIINTDSRAGTIDIRANDNINIEDSESSIAANSGGGEAGGIIINTPTLDVSGSIEAITQFFGKGTDTFSINTNTLTVYTGGRLSTRTEGDANAGSMQITTGKLDIVGGEITSTTNNSGLGGDIIVKANELVVGDAGNINASTSGQGHGGFIKIEAFDVKLQSKGSISNDTNFSPGSVRGDGGDIRFVNTRKLTVNNGDITTNSNLGGDAGDIYFDNVGEIKLNNGNITATTNQGGQGGNISFNAVDRLSLTNDSDISVSSIINTDSRAGTIDIRANDNINIEDSESSIAANSGGGEAGGIIINTPTLDVSGSIEAITQFFGKGTDTFSINTNTLTVYTGGRLSTRTEGDANAGSMQITTGKLDIAGGEITSTTSNAGLGGGIDVSAHRITVDKGGMISSKSTGIGNAGSIFIKTSDALLILDNSSIETSADFSTGGNVDIQSKNLVYLLNSNITASAAGENQGDNGGNVTIDPIFVILSDSAITANANQGFGGDISITAQSFLRDNNSSVNASSARGAQFDGNIIIDSPNQDVTATVTILDASFLDVSGLLRHRCSVATQGESSSFAVNTQAGDRRSPDTYFREFMKLIDIPESRNDRKNITH